jgi:hypothetical protein
VVTASQESWIEPFSGLRPRVFAKLVRQLRREGADAPRPGRPWSLSLADRVLLVAAYWRTNLTMRQLAPLFGISKSAADRVIDDLGPKLALRPRKRFAKDAVLIVDGTLVPTRDRSIAAPSKNYRYSTNHQVVIDADTQLVVVVGTPVPGNRNDCRAFGESVPKRPAAQPMSSAMAATSRPRRSSHTAAAPGKTSWLGRKRTTPPTGRSAPESSTRSHG